MKYQSVLFACMKLHNIKDSPPLPQESWSGSFFFFPYSLSSISALLKRQKRLMMEDTRWRDRCQQDGEKNPKTNTFSLDD